jgi:hypothetical protein
VRPPFFQGSPSVSARRSVAPRRPSSSPERKRSRWFSGYRSIQALDGTFCQFDAVLALYGFVNRFRHISSRRLDRSRTTWDDTPERYNPHGDCTSDGLDDLDGFSPLYSPYARHPGPIVNENSVHPSCTHRAPKPHAIAANAMQVERRRNPHFMGVSRTWSYVVVVHRNGLQQMVNRVLTSPPLCCRVAHAAGGPAVDDV